jgi:hypothetical protein
MRNIYLNANLNLRVVHPVSTDEVLATESWRNNHSTLTEEMLFKACPEAKGGNPATGLLIGMLVT